MGAANSGGGRRSRGFEISARLDRPLPSFGSHAPVPRNAGKARFGTVTPETIEKYAACLRDFFDWASQFRSLKTVSEDIIDELMCRYFDILLRDAWHPYVGRYVLFGYLLFFPRSDIKKASRLTMAREAIAGWVRRVPGASRHPWPIGVFFLLMSRLLSDNAVDAAIACLLQFDAYLRPSEVCSLRWASVAAPTTGLGTLYSSKWAIVIGNADLGERTKTGQSDDTVILGSPGREWVLTVLKLWHAHQSSSGSEFVFPGLTLARYEKLFRCHSKRLLHPIGFVTPHVVRHSAPSHDVFSGSRSLAQVKRRGRWAHDNSVKRYEKSGRLLLQASRLPTDIARKARAAECSIFVQFQEALK